MISETKIEFLRGGLITSLQGENINNLQHFGITTSGPMDYFLSKIGNLIMDNKKDDLTFEICKFGPKIKIIEGNFIFLVSGNINFKIIRNSNILLGKCFKSYVLKKGDILLFYKDTHYVASVVLQGTEDNEEITENLNKLLEKMILLNPSQWIWTHDRWK